MLNLLVEIIWHKFRGLALASLSIVSVYSLVVETRYPYSGLLTLKDLISLWSWWVWFLIFLFLLLFFTLIVANQKRRLLEHHDNWIIAHKAKTGKLPVLPHSLLPLVGNYESGKPISNEIELMLRPSQQLWGSLTEDNQKRYKQLLLWKGFDPLDFEQQLKNTAPPGGSRITSLHRKSSQGEEI